MLVTAYRHYVDYLQFTDLQVEKVQKQLVIVQNTNAELGQPLEKKRRHVLAENDRRIEISQRAFNKAEV